MARPEHDGLDGVAHPYHSHRPRLHRAITGPGMCASPSSPVPRGLSLCGLSPLASGEKPYRGRLAARVQPDDARHVCLSGHKA